MIKLFKHDTVMQPFFIALSDDLRFHALYDGVSVSSANSLSGVIEAIPNKDFYRLSGNPRDWKRLQPILPDVTQDA